MYNQLHPQGGVGQNTTIFTYNLLSLSIPPTSIRATVIRHHNQNQFRLTVWTEYNGRLEPPQGNNYVRNMQWTVTEAIKKITMNLCQQKCSLAPKYGPRVTDPTISLTNIEPPPGL